MRNVFKISLLLCSQVLWSQSPSGPPAPLVGASDLERRIQQEAFERWALDTDAPKKAAMSKEAESVQEFYSKARHFVDLWQAFAAELNEKKTVNAKLAKQISKAFHDLEKTNGWPTGTAK